VFKVEAQHLVIFMFTESRVALLWVYMAIMCREVEQIQIEKSVDAGWSVRQIAVVLGQSVSMVSREIRRNKWVAWNENESYRPFRDVWLHTWSGDHGSVPGGTGRAPAPEASIQLAPATCVCSGSDGGLDDRQTPGGVDAPG